jgi:hypothetical protein
VELDHLHVLRAEARLLVDLPRGLLGHVVADILIMLVLEARGVVGRIAWAAM